MKDSGYAGLIHQTNEDKIFNTIIISILFVVICITLYPLLFVLSASVSSPEMVLQGKVWLFPKGLTFQAYKAVFQDPKIMTGYINTVKYTLVGTIVNLIMTIAGAYPLSRKDFYGRNVITFFLTVTMFFSGGMIPTYILIKSLNLYNSFWVMILPGAVSMWNLIIMRNYFQYSIPNELLEAAYMDGCSNIGALIKVVLPLSKPILAVMVIFYGVAHWNAYFDALLYLSDSNKFPLQLVLREILLLNDTGSMTAGTSETMADQQLLTESLKYAVIVAASLPVVMLYPLLQKYFVKGIMVGAIKG
ncbi:MAG TPA: carbohydrate ABC transporter permease [Bacillota bacterium]|nr:carbohydrate ABC transporter permease [Bacillota bacterium]